MAKSTKPQKLVINTLPLIYDNNCTVLIVGTFPGAESRKSGIYYANPGNRFWPIIGCSNMPATITDQEAYLLGHNIALGDICNKCTIGGSKDSTIKIIECNDLCSILKNSKIRHIFCNGKKAYKLFQKCLKEHGCELNGITVECLPSTSPANGWWNKLDGDAKWAYALKNRRP